MKGTKTEDYLYALQFCAQLKYVIIIYGAFCLSSS